MAQIKEFYDRFTDETVYPSTVTQAVMCPDGRDLESRLNTDRRDIESQLSNIYAEELISPERFPDIDELTRDELKKGLFIDMWLATLNMFPLMPTYDDDVAATLADGSQFGVNGLVLSYEEAIEVMRWSKPNENAGGGVFSYDYNIPATVQTLFPIFVNVGASMEHCWRACNSVRAITVYSTKGAVISPTKALNLFAACTGLEKIYGIIDLQYITSDSNVLNTFLQLRNLVSVNISGLKCNISLAGSPLLSLESLRYMVEHATNTSAITITVHPVVYAKLTDENNEEWHRVLTDAVAKNITFATV